MTENHERYLLYIDESGVPELSANTSLCFLTGVLLNEKDEESFLFLVERLKDRYRLNKNRHLHAVDLFENKSPTTKTYLGKTLRRPTQDLRKKFQEDIWSLIKDFNIQHYTVAVSKEISRKVLGLNKTIDHGKSWIQSSNYYARVDRQSPMDIGINAVYHWGLKSIGRNAKLKVILESRSGDEFTLRNSNIIKGPDVFKNKWMISFSRNWKEQVVSLGFANKMVRSAGLEFADIISYTCNIYYLQFKKKTGTLDSGLKKAICFKGIHKTLNSKHYVELSEQGVKKYLPGLSSRTRRITEYYSRRSLSPANAGAQLS